MNKQLRLLKKIKKSSIYDYSNKKNLEIDTIYYFKQCGYIICNEETNVYGEPTGKKTCTISPAGINYLNLSKRDTLRWMIPNILSVIAIIISIIALLH